MYPTFILRIEGAAVAAAAVAGYFALDGPLRVFLLFALAPDLSMLGYLAGNRVGATLYNAAHTYVSPVALGAIGVWSGVPMLPLLALVWAAHIGVDRAVGYGLQYPSGFGDTHLSRLDRPGRTGKAGVDGAPEVRVTGAESR